VTIRTAIPGADELTGKGVYCGMPENVPQPVRDKHAVVVGKCRMECAAAARQLRKAGWKVTMMTSATTNVVWATGIEYLEALVLRRVDTGRIDACNASALFIL
jgi:hypothetical protein